jgi:hypothetical protein
VSATPVLTARDVAKARWQEAERVKDAYDSMVIRRRHKWRASVPGKEADRARRDLQDAIVQQSAAGKTERDAWKTWHALDRTGP